MEGPTIVALEDECTFLVEADHTSSADARRAALEAAGAATLDVEATNLGLTYFRPADDEAPPGLRSEPYFVECSGDDPDARVAWKIEVG